MRTLIIMVSIALVSYGWFQAGRVFETNSMHVISETQAVDLEKAAESRLWSLSNQLEDANPKEYELDLYELCNASQLLNKQNLEDCETLDLIERD